jgi:hypothetical protein
MAKGTLATSKNMTNSPITSRIFVIVFSQEERAHGQGNCKPNVGLQEIAHDLPSENEPRQAPCPPFDGHDACLV